MGGTPSLHNTIQSDVMSLDEVASFPLGPPRVGPSVALPGGRVATGHNDSIRVWTTTGELLATLEGHAGVVFALACTTAGDIVSGCFDGTVKVWRDNACVRTLRGHRGVGLRRAVYAVVVSPFDDTIVSGSYDRTAKVWSASTGECVATLEGHVSCVSAVCVLSNGDVATASFDWSVRVWQRGSWACTAVHAEGGEVWRMAALPGGGLVVGCVYRHRGGRSWVSVWEGCKRKWVMRVTGFIHRLDVVQDIIVACSDHTIFIQEGVCVKKQWSPMYEAVAALPNGNLALAATEGDTAVCKVYSVARPSRIAIIQVMIAGWFEFGGMPPPPPPLDVQDAAAALARTLSLRRLCRPRFDVAALEIVEPFARDVVGFI